MRGARSVLPVIALAIGCPATKSATRGVTTAPVAPAVRYDTAAIVRGTVKSVVVTSGQLTARQTVDVTSPGSGKIVEVLVDVGARVKKGQLLARLNRKQTVLAPIDGVVLSREIEAGQVVALGASSSPTLFTLASDLAAMKLEVLVGEAEIARLAVGMHGAFTVPVYPQAVFAGTVAQIDRMARRVTLEVANDGLQLRPGMTADVTIETAVHADVLLAPASALRFRARPGQTTVWRMASGGTPIEVVVRSGISDGTVVEILDGVHEGDQVVTASH